MRELTDEDVDFVRGTTRDIMIQNGIERWDEDLANPYLVEVKVPVSVGKAKATKAFNELFHALGVLPESKNLPIGEGGDYCATCVNEGGETYGGLYNFPFAKDFKKGDEEYQFTLKAIFDAQEEAGRKAEAEMKELVAGIKAGKLKSKSSDGYLVLKAEFYDAIESGRHPVEYRDFTKYNLKRTIGIKTIRFNRGYAKNAPQMRWEVKKIVLLDDDDNACDPFNVPKDFWPTTIALHLGKRIG